MAQLVLFLTNQEEFMADTNKGNNKTAHSNFRKGMSDYHDGENVTDQLGNDDWKNSNNLPDPYGNTADFDGSEAAGNDLIEGEDDESNSESANP